MTQAEYFRIVMLARSRTAEGAELQTVQEKPPCIEKRLFFGVPEQSISTEAIREALEATVVLDAVYTMIEMLDQSMPKGFTARVEEFRRYLQVRTILAPNGEDSGPIWVPLERLLCQTATQFVNRVRDRTYPPPCPVRLSPIIPAIPLLPHVPVVLAIAKCIRINILSK